MSTYASGLPEVLVFPEVSLFSPQRGQASDDRVSPQAAAERHQSGRNAYGFASSADVLPFSRGYAANYRPSTEWLGPNRRQGGAAQVALVSAGADFATARQTHHIDVAHVQFSLGLAQVGMGHPAEATAAFEEAYRHFQGLGSTLLAASVLKTQLVDVTLRYETDNQRARWRLVKEYERQWSDAASHAGRVDDGVAPPLFAELILSGRWDEARTSALAHRHVSVLWSDCVAALAELALRRGDFNETREQIRSALPDGPVMPLGAPFSARILDLMALAAELALAEGDPEEALAWIETYERWLAWTERVPGRSTAQLLRASRHQLLGEHDAAIERAWAALAMASEPRQPLGQLAARRMLGNLELAAGRYDEAGRHFTTALSLADACGAPYERARLLLDQAELSIAARRAFPDDSTVDEIRTLLAALNARPMLERLESLHARRPATSKRTRAIAGLSVREIEVLQLVARGMTDAEVGGQLFISPRTVNRHLQSIYGKLDVNTRTAAAAFAFQHRLAG